MAAVSFAKKIRVQLRLISAGTSKKTAVVAAVLFMMFAVVSHLVLPARYSYDADNMVDIAENIVAGGDPSYDVIASLIRIFTVQGLTLFVETLGICIIFFSLSDRRLPFTLGLATFSLALTAPLSLVRPQKELLVFLLTIACAWVIQRSKNQSSALLYTLVAYGVYSWISWRPYYLLIVGMIVALSIFTSLSSRMKVAALVGIFLAGFFLPSSVFELLQMPRDMVNALRVLYPEIEGNRTAFANPIQSLGWLSFLGNYFYAFLRLNLPVLFSLTLNEAILTVFSTAWFYVIWVASAAKDWRSQFAARLMMAHLLVLWIFEPDLGSYLRHYSSCLLYLVLMLQAVERRHFNDDAEGRRPPPREVSSGRAAGMAL